jgi:hypothetical protein
MRTGGGEHRLEGLEQQMSLFALDDESAGGSAAATLG